MGCENEIHLPANIVEMCQSVLSFFAPGWQTDSSCFIHLPTTSRYCDNYFFLKDFLFTEIAYYFRSNVNHFSVLPYSFIVYLIATVIGS